MICDVIQRGDLEAYVFGEASPDAARKVESHLFGCAECATEMRVLRSERRLFRARQEVVPAEVPSFESLLARLDAPDASSSPRRPFAAASAESRPVVSMDSRSAGSMDSRSAGSMDSRSAGSVESKPVGSRPSIRSPRGSLVIGALVAVAAAFTLFVRGQTVSSDGVGTDTGAPEIAAEEVCGSDEVVWIPVSREPLASYDRASLPSSDPVGRADSDRASCVVEAHEACDCGEPEVTYACDDATAACGSGRQ